MIVLRRLHAENFKLLKRVDLDFPRQGSVLVEGLNESGKSTFFESVYFALYGAPLATEGRGRGTLDSAIRYGEDSMSVELLLEVDDTELEIRRVVKRGKPSQARLFLRRPGMPDEQVTGVLAVNDRIVEELGGLDGEALLNSCFVEQKKLSKLEDLASAQRKESLRKLLNLEKLTALAERFRVTSQDERALAEARQRLELAEVAARLPAVAAERSNLESVLRGETYPDAVGQGPVPCQAGQSAPPYVVEAGVADRRQGAAPTESSVISHQPSVNGEQRTANSVQNSEPRTQNSEPITHHPSPITHRSVWSDAAARLAATRASAVRARRNALLLGAGAGALLLASLAAALAGTHVALWGVLPAILLGLLAVLAYRPVDALNGRATRLEEELAEHRDALVAKSGELEGLRVRAEQRLGVQGGDLDLEECRVEVARLERQMAVKRRAGEIVEGTMERIVRMVLPNTERNLGQILPLLTAGRYHEARIGEDYQVQVWDDSAGRYVSKGIFSGGARDQFSLALRLAFALATLPQELGTTPGFIFLDEPLSSFDGPRTEALVRLLTEGQIAANFSQIFVISHNRSFDLAAFQYRLVLRDGRVVESTLPTANGRGGEWES